MNLKYKRLNFIFGRILHYKQKNRNNFEFLKFKHLFYLKIINN